VCLLQVCVVQFSNDTRVEVPLGPLDKPAFDTAIKAMVRRTWHLHVAANNVYLVHFVHVLQSKYLQGCSRHATVCIMHFLELASDGSTSSCHTTPLDLCFVIFCGGVIKHHVTQCGTDLHIVSTMCACVCCRCV
jgi:hypothetical protein